MYFQIIGSRYWASGGGTGRGGGWERPTFYVWVDAGPNCRPGDRPQPILSGCRLKHSRPGTAIVCCTGADAVYLA